jgi:integrase/recombinase XerD
VLKSNAPEVLICRVTLECLPRISEVLSIQTSHIGPNWIEIRWKGGKVGRIAVTPELRTALLARAHSSGYVFGEGTKGKPPAQRTASKRIVRLTARLGLVGVSHHTFRHTGVTLMLEAGVNPRVIQQLAGWSSLRMLERYGHARDAELQRAVTSNAAHLTTLQATEGKSAVEA